jgi:hypothetical protein
MGFNDPVELTPRISKPSDELLLDRLLAEHLIEDYFQSVGLPKGMTKEESYREYHAVELPKRFLKLQDQNGWEPKAMRLKWEMIERFSENFHVLCCSHRHDSILMWSHYAAKHTGIVIEFDPDELFPGMSLTNHFKEVRYRSSPPTISALHADVPSFEKAMEDALTTKALEWAYEEEIRIMMPNSLLQEGEGHRYRAFDPQGIKRVIVGCLMDAQSSTYQEIDGLADQPYTKMLFSKGRHFMKTTIGLSLQHGQETDFTSSARHSHPNPALCSSVASSRVFRPWCGK